MAKSIEDFKEGIPRVTDWDAYRDGHDRIFGRVKQDDMSQKHGDICDNNEHENDERNRPAP